MTSTSSVTALKTPRRSWKYRGARLLGGVIFCYLGIVIVLMLLENWLLFHPLRATQYWLPPPNGLVQDVELWTSNGTRIHAWWCPPKNWLPAQGALLYCHGNAGNLSCRGDAVTLWQQALGVAVLIFDYPGYGRSDGRPTETGCYAAADAAYQWLIQSRGIQPERLLIYGGSLGGGVAVDLASRQPHRALLLVKTFTSIPDAAQSVYPWLPARWLVRNRFDNLEKIGRCTRPIFIAHGTTDSLVPFVHGQRLFEAASEPKRFLAMAGVDHNDGLSPQFFAALRPFLDESSPAARDQPAAGAAAH